MMFESRGFNSIHYDGRLTLCQNQQHNDFRVLRLRDRMSRAVTELSLWTD